MDEKIVLEIVNNYLVKIKKNGKIANINSNIKDDLDLDSLDCTEILIILEIKNVNDFIKCLQK